MRQAENKTERNGNTVNRERGTRAARGVGATKRAAAAEVKKKIKANKTEPAERRQKARSLVFTLARSKS